MSLQRLPSYLLFTYTTLFRSSHGIATDTWCPHLMRLSGWRAVRPAVWARCSRPWHEPSTIRAYSRALSRTAARQCATCWPDAPRSEEHTSELQSRGHVVCRLL